MVFVLFLWLGGTLGAVLGAATGQDFKPLAAIIMELPTHTKQELTDRINNIVSGFDPADIVTFLALIRGSAALRLQLINGVKSYLEQQQGINVTCWPHLIELGCHLQLAFNWATIHVEKTLLVLACHKHLWNQLSRYVLHECNHYKQLHEFLYPQ